MSGASHHASSLNAEQVGYKQSLGRRHVQMIAIGGAIGTGLFLGSASRLNSTGPALLVSYAFVGVIAYFLMRALGELVLHRATSGAFVSYMREFYGEKWAFVTGWMYWLNWALTGIAELSAVGLYVQHWWPNMPTWQTVLIALAVVLVINLLSARAFGEFEFWASSPRSAPLSSSWRSVSSSCSSRWTSADTRPASRTSGTTPAAFGRRVVTTTGTAPSW
jgi:L-asparagine permease